MPTLALRLDPTLLMNPDLDLRYLLPDAIERETGGRARADGYDYGRRTQALVCFLAVAAPPDLAAVIAQTIAFLERETLLGNRLAGRVVLAVSDEEHADDDATYRCVYPAGARFTLD